MNVVKMDGGSLNCHHHHDDDVCICSYEKVQFSIYAFIQLIHSQQAWEPRTIAVLTHRREK